MSSINDSGENEFAYEESNSLSVELIPHSHLHLHHHHNNSEVK
jgi:hypothetical protein